MPDDDVPEWWDDDSVTDALVSGGAAFDSAVDKILVYLKSKYEYGKACRVAFTRESPNCFSPMKAWVLNCGNFTVFDDTIVKELDALASGGHGHYYQYNAVRVLLEATADNMAQDFRKSLPKSAEPTCPATCNAPKGPPVWSTKCDFHRIATGEGKGHCEVKVTLQ